MGPIMMIVFLADIVAIAVLVVKWLHPVRPCRPPQASAPFSMGVSRLAQSTRKSIAPATWSLRNKSG
jgi:hypothetical protein